MEVIVVSDVCGEQAGAYVATLFLCRRLSSLGHEVTCFAGHVSGEVDAGREPFALRLPPVRRGWRWELPHRSLAAAAARAARRHPSARVVAVGLTGLTGFLLGRLPAGRVLVWELTNADPGNPFVHPRAVARLGQAAAVLSPAAAIDAAVRSTYGYAGPVRRLPFWLEADVDDAARAPGLPDAGRPDFFYMGRRDPGKGLHELIEATATVARSHPHVRVAVAGMGSAAPFREAAERRNIEANVSFPEHPTRASVLAALREAACLVLPSHHEGYPLVLLEAARAGVPVIATSVGGIPEIFPGTPGTRLVPPRDAAALAAAMMARMAEAREDTGPPRDALRLRFSEICGAAGVAARLRTALELS